MSKSDSIEQQEALMRRESLAFAISLNAIRINLLGLLVCFCLLIYKVLEPVDFDVYNAGKGGRNPGGYGKKCNCT